MKENLIQTASMCEMLYRTCLATSSFKELEIIIETLENIITSLEMISNSTKKYNILDEYETLESMIIFYTDSILYYCKSMRTKVGDKITTNNPLIKLESSESFEYINLNWDKQDHVSGSETDEKSQKGKRGKRLNHDSEAKKILIDWLYENRVNPYPTEIEKQRLSLMTNLKPHQINNWFINARRRILPSMINE
jgi:hypothetical protein